MRVRALCISGLLLFPLLRPLQRFLDSLSLEIVETADRGGGGFDNPPERERPGREGTLRALRRNAPEFLPLLGLGAAGSLSQIPFLAARARAVD